MNKEEAKSCIQTIELLKSLAYNIHGMMDVVDAWNCKKIIELLESQAQVVRCKDCKWRGNKKKCIVAFVADKQEFPLFFYDNRGEWFCADGERKDDGNK